MLHDHLPLCILAVLGLLWAFYAYMVWKGKRIEEEILYRKDEEEFPLEEYEEFWTKDKKVL